MLKRILPLLAICLVAGTAHAQSRGGGGRHGGHGGQGAKPAAPSPNGDAPAAAPKPLSANEIVGLVKAVDIAGSRVTITYSAVDALSWPAGTMPFVVAKPELLKDVTVGEKVRFRLESQQIIDLKPF